MRWSSLALTAAALARAVAGEDILRTVGMSDCGSESATVKVTRMHMQYRAAAQEITFDVQGLSLAKQEVKAYLSLSAYGQLVYEQTFDPCDADNTIDQLCPGEWGEQ
jgi:hypothetical protein